MPARTRRINIRKCPAGLPCYFRVKASRASIASTPGSPAAYVTRILIPRFSPDIKGYRILAVEGMPLWAAASVALKDARSVGIKATARGACVRIAYRLGGRAVDEEFYVLMPSLYMVGLHNWGAEWATSVRAEPGRLAHARKIHQAVTHSVRLNLRWYNRVAQVAEMLTDGSAISGYCATGSEK